MASLQGIFEEPQIRELLVGSRYRQEDLIPILAIADRHGEHFDNVAKNLLAEIKGFEKVHSVKYRVKDLSSLCKKILKKEKKEQRKVITEENLPKEISDIMGLRILYLYPSDFPVLHRQIMSSFGSEQVGAVCVNHRVGDDLSFFKNVLGEKDSTYYEGIYRSVHYNIWVSTPGNKKWKAEIQVRTIFEEAWSEMYHSAYKSELKDFELFQLVSANFSTHIRTCNEMSELMKFCEKHYEEMRAAEKKSPLRLDDLPAPDDLIKKIWNENR